MISYNEANLPKAINFVGGAFKDRPIDLNPHYRDGNVDKDFEVEV